MEFGNSLITFYTFIYLVLWVFFFWFYIQFSVRKQKKMLLLGSTKILFPNDILYLSTVSLKKRLEFKNNKFYAKIRITLAFYYKQSLVYWAVSVSWFNQSTKTSLFDQMESVFDYLNLCILCNVLMWKKYTNFSLFGYFLTEIHLLFHLRVLKSIDFAPLLSMATYISFLGYR